MTDAQNRSILPDYVPVRYVNEYVYCPRLAYLEWIQGEFAHNADTLTGKFKHERVDHPGGRLPPATSVPEDTILHARSIQLSSKSLRVIAKIDLVESKNGSVRPVDYKKGKRPHVESGAYLPERVQVCLQGLLLREHGYSCREGLLYFIGSKERVRVRFTDNLIQSTIESIQGLIKLVDLHAPPEPLQDSPKCPRCSLVGICMPDETRFLSKKLDHVRPIIPRSESAYPLYIESPKAYVHKEGFCFIVEENHSKIARVPIRDVSQIILFGWSSLSTPALHECFRRSIPVSFMTYGGWFVGHTIGTGHHNVQIRINQYRYAEDPKKALQIARSLIAAKISNGRVLLRRNWPSNPVAEKNQDRKQTLHDLKNDKSHALQAHSIDQLLGIEGSAAARYFKNFPKMIKVDDYNHTFDFNGRNRRPPLDPLNAMLSFAYAMLVREWSTVISAVGLDPYLGFYHQPRFARPSLALDMCEPFRPLIADSTVIRAVNTGMIKPQDFIIHSTACLLSKSGRKKFIAAFEQRLSEEITHPLFKYKISYRRVFEVQTRLLTRFLLGEIQSYPSFMTR